MARRRLRWRFGFGEALEQSSLEDAHGTGVECYSGWKPRVTLAASLSFRHLPRNPAPASHPRARLESPQQISDLPFFLPPPMAPATTPLSLTCAGRTLHWPPAPTPVLLLPPSAAQVISDMHLVIAEALNMRARRLSTGTRHREILPLSSHPCLPPTPSSSHRQTYQLLCLPVVGTSLAYLAPPLPQVVKMHHPCSSRRLP